MTLNLNDFSKQIQKNQLGIWFGPNWTQKSYPKDGHVACLQVEDSSFWFRHRNQCINDMIQLYPPGGEIWDIGGGNGYVSKFLQDNGQQTVLLEPGPEGAQNGILRGVKNVICADICETDFKNESLSSVGLFDVIEHIENEDPFLKRIHALLKKSGRLYLTTPAYQFLWSDEDVYAGHFRRYTTASIQTLLQRNGFKVLFKSYIFSFLPIPIFLLRTLPFLIHNKKLTSSNVTGDHQTTDSFLKKIILFLLSLENLILRRKRPLPFGGTVILVAEKC